MTSTLDSEVVFGALTRLCVDSFADWAIIDLAEEGRTLRIAGAHRDPEKESLLRELAERYPAGVGSRAPARTCSRRRRRCRSPTSAPKTYAPARSMSTTPS